MRIYALFCLVMVGQVMGRDISIIGRISNGKIARQGQFPYQVFITYIRGIYQLACGGAIISKKYILTGAHCIDDEFISDPESVIVRVGSIYRNNGTDLTITRVVRHPDFDSDNNNNDIAVLTTDKDIVFDDNVKAIDLPAKNRDVEGEVTVSAWGRLTYTDPRLPLRMRYADIPVLDYDSCKTTIGPKLTENMWCAGNYTLGEASPCNGDSGGPATQDDVLVGLGSKGRRCAETGFPTVFTNIASPSVRNFIKRTTRI